jgi:hypothetical protein
MINYPEITQVGAKVRLLSTAWSQIKNRTENTQDDRYPNYGGRGIKLCERWRDPDTFIWDLLPTLPYLNHGHGLSIDRIDNDGHYEPNNVRWATAKEQARNRRSNVSVTAFGNIYDTKVEAWEDLSSRGLLPPWMKQKTFNARIAKYDPVIHGDNLDLYLGAPKGKTKKTTQRKSNQPFTYQGKEYTSLAHAAREEGCSRGFIRYRVSQGMSPQEALDMFHQGEGTVRTR